MGDDYSYAGVPTTTEGPMGNEGHNPPIEPSETHTLPEPEAPTAPTPSALTLVCLFLPLNAQILISWS